MPPAVRPESKPGLVKRIASLSKWIAPVASRGDDPPRFLDVGAGEPNGILAREVRQAIPGLRGEQQKPRRDRGDVPIRDGRVGEDHMRIRAAET
jgi:hypothetical protein